MVLYKIKELFGSSSNDKIVLHIFWKFSSTINEYTY